MNQTSQTQIEARCVAIADTVVPNYRNGKRAYSCTSQAARMWQAAYDGAAATLGGGGENTHPAATGSVREAAVGRFWLIVHEPGNVPDRKGSWPRSQLPQIMREFIAARHNAYLTVLTVDADGTPDVQHGPEALQMADGRSMSVGRKHNARTLAAHSAAAPTSDAATGKGKEVAALIQWARDQMALPDGSGWLGGRIDENHRYKLRDLIDAIDAAAPDAAASEAGEATCS